MAHLSIISAFLYVFFAVALLSSSVVTVLDTELAPSPSPSPLIETGAGVRGIYIAFQPPPMLEPPKSIHYLVGHPTLASQQLRTLGQHPPKRAKTHSQRSRFVQTALAQPSSSIG
ncbi:hypothetical protein GOBAR_DD09492 [Gossypium barbadense]|nr:hypothetical protein GOBAR_DD09492 [Gossypium barbadense]